MIHYYCFFACYVSALPIIECGREEGRTRIPATHTKVNTQSSLALQTTPPPAPRAHAPDPPAGGGRRGRAQRARRAR